MVWVKVPVEHHPMFRAALPRDPRIQTLQLFGGVAAKVNGHLFAGLFARSVIVSLDDADRDEALALDGAGYFDPMGDGVRVSTKHVMLPEDTFADPHDLRDWIGRAFAYVSALPKKEAKPKARAAAKAVATRPKPRASVAKAKPTPASGATPATKAKPIPGATPGTKAKPASGATPATKPKRASVAKPATKAKPLRGRRGRP